MHDDTHLLEAIRETWSASTSATPDEWSVHNPAKGQCDASAYVLWEHLGGDLVLGEVIVGGVRTEHHDWNRVDGADIDVTRSQFAGHEQIREISVLTAATIRERSPSMRRELAGRIEAMRSGVADRLAAQ